MIRIGNGYDVHCLVKDRPLILGGVTIPHHSGLLGHSDADVLAHAISDAILGAIAKGSIGHHFPDTDRQYKNASSLTLLKHCVQLAIEAGFKIGNVDTVVAAQAPKLNPFIPLMRQNLALAMSIRVNDISVKATTTENLGFEGREEGISVYAVVLLTTV